MGLDRAPIEFQTFYFSHVLVVPPNQGSNIKMFHFPGKDQTIQIPDITVCHEHPYQSLERIDEMVTSKGYEENTYGLSDLVAYSHRNYSVQTVSIFSQNIVYQ